MKILESEHSNGNYSLNFVDDNNVFVGFCDDSCCCENYGYRIFGKIYEGRDIDDDVLTPQCKDLDGFNFDKEFFKEIENSSDSGGTVVFRLTKGDEEIFLHLYNFHNGFYSHGFELRENENLLREGSL